MKLNTYSGMQTIFPPILAYLKIIYKKLNSLYQYLKLLVLMILN